MGTIQRRKNLRKVAIMIKPFMEETTPKMFTQLGINDDELMAWNSIYEYPEYESGLKVVEKGEPLFVRLDLAEEIEFLKNEMQK